jgi:quinol monooxygenase YgiN
MMSILVTMRVKVYDFAGTKRAATKYAQRMKKAGCKRLKIYRSAENPNFVLWLTEWEDREAFESLGSEVEEDINALVNPVGAWDQVVWQLADVVELD